MVYSFEHFFSFQFFFDQAGGCGAFVAIFYGAAFAGFVDDGERDILQGEVEFFPAFFVEQDAQFDSGEASFGAIGRAGDGEQQVFFAGVVKLDSAQVGQGRFAFFGDLSPDEMNGCPAPAVVFVELIGVGVVLPVEMQFFIYLENTSFFFAMGQVEHANEENVFETKSLRQEVGKPLKKHFSCGGVTVEPLEQVFGPKGFCVQKFSDVFGHFAFGHEQGGGEIAGFKMAEDVLEGFHFKEGGGVGALVQLQELEPQLFADLKGALGGVEAALDEQLSFVGDAEGSDAIELGPGVEAVFDEFEAKLMFEDALEFLDGVCSLSGPDFNLEFLPEAFDFSFEFFEVVVVHFEVGAQGSEIEIFFAQGVVAGEFYEGGDEGGNPFGGLGDDVHDFMQLDAKEVEGYFAQEVGFEQVLHGFQRAFEGGFLQFLRGYVEGFRQMEELFGLGVFLALFDFVEVGDGEAGTAGKLLEGKPFAQPVVAYF